MRELLLSTRISDSEYLTKEKLILEDNDSMKNLSVVSTNLETIIKNCRLTIMTDSAVNKPRKIILDTKRDNCKSSSPRHKEAARLFEIVFGNFCLSSKADGFKLHILKNPAEVILTKLFNVPYNPIFYDNKALYRKVSPDSGHTQSFSSNSSLNSGCSSNFSPPSSIVVHPLSANSTDSVASNLSLSRSTSRNRAQAGGLLSSSLLKDTIKNSNSSFFNDTYDICNYRSNVMMSAVFIFSLPDENKAEFEEFIFQYYSMLESVLNRIARIILDNCHSIYNGQILNCWKQSKRWIVSLLPQHSSPLSVSCTTRCNVPLSRSTVNSRFNVHMFEEVVQYFSKEKRLSFLSDIISAVMASNPNASSKYLKKITKNPDCYFPYLYLLRNLGIDTEKQSFDRIIVKGLGQSKKVASPPSWKERLSTSLNNYKKMWHSQIDNNSISCTDIDLYSRGISPFIGDSLTRTMSDNLAGDCQEVRLLMGMIADMVRPYTKVAYQPHRLPTDVSLVINSRLGRISEDRSAIEIPLLDDGLLLDQEILPDNNELFYPAVISYDIVGSLVPLQGYISASSGANFESQLLLESRQSGLIHDSLLYHPDFLVIDVDHSTVTNRVLCTTLSTWIKEIVDTFSVLIKVDGYDSDIGNLFLESAFETLSQKLSTIKRDRSSSPRYHVDPYLEAINEFTESDLSLLLRKKSR